MVGINADSGSIATSRVASVPSLPSVSVATTLTVKSASIEKLSNVTVKLPSPSAWELSSSPLIVTVTEAFASVVPDTSKSELRSSSSSRLSALAVRASIVGASGPVTSIVIVPAASSSLTGTVKGPVSLSEPPTLISYSPLAEGNSVLSSSSAQSPSAST